ncbi:MAG: hypothetical protein OXC91_09660 [Rhodobacteraceae bacterium]|nr:hypothetical protein [Paracoccaceae bacterium]
MRKVAKCLGEAYDFLGRLGYALIQALFTICITFLPILFLSLPWIQHPGDTHPGVWNSFLRHWEKGEISLPLLGICGTVAWLLYYRDRLRRWQRALIGLYVTMVVLGAGYAISETDGFSQPLTEMVFLAAFAFYAFTVAIWIYLATKKDPELEVRKSQADEILDAVRQQSSEEGGK